MIDLRTINTPFGDLDAETQQRLQNAKGPWEYSSPVGPDLTPVWVKARRARFWTSLTYRLAPDGEE